MISRACILLTFSLCLPLVFPLPEKQTNNRELLIQGSLYADKSRLKKEAVVDRSLDVPRNPEEAKREGVSHHLHADGPSAVSAATSHGAGASTVSANDSSAVG